MSTQIYGAVLLCIQNLKIKLDTKEASVALYQLLMAMDPKTISLHVITVNYRLFGNYILIYYTIFRL